MWGVRLLLQTFLHSWWVWSSIVIMGMTTVQDGNFPIGDEWGENGRSLRIANLPSLKRGRSVDTYAGVPISCYYCSIFVGTVGNNPNRPAEDDQCKHEKEVCTGNIDKSNCCAGEYLYCTKKGKCNWSAVIGACGTDKDCTDRGPKFKGHTCNTEWKWCEKTCTPPCFK